MGVPQFRQLRVRTWLGFQTSSNSPHVFPTHVFDIPEFRFRTSSGSDPLTVHKIAQIVNTGNPGFPEPWLSEIRRRTWKNPGIFLICQVFFWVFQAEDFGKLSAPVFRIFLDRFRAPGTKFRPISSYFSLFCSAF